MLRLRLTPAVRCRWPQQQQAVATKCEAPSMRQQSQSRDGCPEDVRSDSHLIIR